MGLTLESDPRKLPASGAESTPRKESQIPSIRLLINGQGEGAAMLFDKAIENGYQIVGIVGTIKKDKEGNMDPLRQRATDLGIPIVNLGDINNRKLDDPKFLAAKQKMRDMNADLAVGFYLQATLDDETIAIPEYGTMNMHLGDPTNRGRESMNRDILNGSPTVSIMTYMMNEIMDGGPVVDVKSYPNPGDKSQGALYFQYLPDFVQMVSDSIDKLAIGIDNNRKTGEPLPLTPQDHSKAKEYPPLSEEELRADFEKDDAETIKRKMLAGGIGSTALIEGEVYKISRPAVFQGAPFVAGRIVEKSTDSVLLEASQGLISIGRLQKKE